jgi:HSP20 family molecular chaperone IbpA
LGGFDEGELPGGEGPGFTWSQTKADVEVCVTLPPGTKAKQLAVDIKRNSLKVALLSGGVLFEAPQLNAGVNADESTWTIEDGSLMLTLEKARKDGIWRMLNVEGEGGDKGICSSE